MSKARKIIPAVAIVISLLLVTGASGISCCKCLNWNQVTVTWTGSSPGTWTGACDSVFQISSINSGTAISATSSISCSSGCQPSYTWSVTTQDGTPVGNGTGLPASFTPTSSGCFTVVLNASCDGKTCPTCKTNICICGIVQPETLYEHYNPNPNGWGGLGQSSWRAQTFTAMSNHSVTSVTLLLSRNEGSIPGTATISIRNSDADGHPTGPDLAIGTTNGDTLPTNTALEGEWREITFCAPCNLISGTKYAIVVRALDATYASPLLWHTVNPGTYADGNFEMSDDGGSTWSASTDFDLLFEVWGN